MFMAGMALVIIEVFLVRLDQKDSRTVLEFRTKVNQMCNVCRGMIDKSEVSEAAVADHCEGGSRRAFGFKGM